MTNQSILLFSNILGSTYLFRLFVLRITGSCQWIGDFGQILMMEYFFDITHFFTFLLSDKAVTLRKFKVETSCELGAQYVAISTVWPTNKVFNIVAEPAQYLHNQKYFTNSNKSEHWSYRKQFNVTFIIQNCEMWPFKWEQILYSLF